MIEALKKYPKTYRRFEKYMGKFGNEDYEFDAEEIYCDDFSMKLPHQFLTGCLMEFLEENGLSLTLYPGNKAGLVKDDISNCYDYKEIVITKAFEILEERE